MNNIKKNLTTLIIIVCALFTNTNVLAGSSASSGEIHYKAEEIAKFAKKVEKTLASKGARVAIIARVGQPREDLPTGINFTHAAIAVYSQITTADNRKIPGYIIYNLYQRDKEPNISDLIQDTPVEFFASANLLEAGIVIPTAELQKRILEVLTSPTYKKLHVKNYSVIANPFTLDFQNCTEHTLDVITAAIYQTDDIKTIKANEKKYYKPIEVDVNPFKLLLGSLFSADVTTSDHPEKVVTATFTSIAEFLYAHNAAEDMIIVIPDK